MIREVSSSKTMKTLYIFLWFIIMSFKLLLLLLLFALFLLLFTTVWRWWVLDLNLQGRKRKSCFYLLIQLLRHWILSWIPGRFLCSFSSWERQFSKFQMLNAPDIQNNVHLIVLSASVVSPVYGIKWQGKWRGEQRDEKPSAPVYS